jgi:hypothetical protein
LPVLEKFVIQLIVRAALFLLACVCIASCGGSSGQPGSAPANVHVTPGDGYATVTWDQQPGLTYWIFSAASSSITRDNYQNFPQPRTTWPATSPQIVSNLTNGTTYAFVMNATKNGSAAGPASASVSTTPRIAGAAWTVAPSAGTADLRALGVGFSKFIAVGAGGALQTSTDGTTWVAGDAKITADLNGVAVSTVGVAVGNGGLMSSTSDGIAWAAVASTGTTSNLNAVTVALGLYVAVGDNGTIITSSDAITWTARTSGTTARLLAVSYLNSRLFAVGEGGTILTSTDGATWTAATSGTTATLRSAAYGGTTVGEYVVVGDGGLILTSTDFTTWTAATSPTNQNLTGIVFGSQFVAVGAGGAALYSPDGLSWSLGSSGTVSNLNAVYRGINFGYLAVGAAGTVINSK